MKVIGLDVCKNAVVTCTLLARPSEPRQLYHDLEFPKFDANAEGIKQILEIGADVAVMEPTGVNYSKIWATRLNEAGVKVVLVGHKELRRYRENLDLPDKDDPADALALACYYWEHHESDRRFVRSRDPVIARMREIVLRLQHFSRVQSPIVNRIRQDLAWQLPETAQISLKGRLFWALSRDSCKNGNISPKPLSNIGFKDFWGQMNGSLKWLGNILQVNYIIAIPLDMSGEVRT